MGKFVLAVGLLVAMLPAYAADHAVRGDAAVAGSGTERRVSGQLEAEGRRENPQGYAEREEGKVVRLS